MIKYLAWKAYTELASKVKIKHGKNTISEKLVLNAEVNH